MRIAPPMPHPAATARGGGSKGSRRTWRRAAPQGPNVHPWPGSGSWRSSRCCWPSTGRSRRYDDGAAQRVTFADVAGIDEATEELSELVDFLRHPERHARLGGRIPSGVLLSGPPGTGKTLLARAVAGEADVPFFSSSASEFIEMVVGVAASRVRRLLRHRRGHDRAASSQLDALATALLERETLDEADAYAAAGVDRHATFDPRGN